MVASRADRRGERTARARESFGAEADAALDVLELVEFAWHDCYGEVSPSEQIVDDIFVAGDGDLATFARAARLAVQDFRDLRLWADSVRSGAS